MNDGDYKSLDDSQAWLTVRSSRVEWSTYEHHRKSIFEFPGNNDDNDDNDDNTAVIAFILGFIVFGLFWAILSPTVDSWDNDFVSLLFLLVAVGLGLLTFAGLILAWHVLDERAREKDPIRGGWTRTGSLPLVGSAKTAAVLSYVIADEIARSPAWSSELFHTARGRLDLGVATRDVVDRAKRIDAAMASLPAGSGGAAPAVRAATSQHLHAASVALAALVDRVQALDEYLDELRGIENLLVALDKVEREIQTVQNIDAIDSAKFDVLYRDAGMGEWNAAETREHAREVAELRETIDSRVDSLRQLTTKGPLPFR